jgi:Tetracyclin repressor-like, C-terminal domain
VACRQRCLALLGQVSREAGPGPVPAVAVTGSDLPGDGQALGTRPPVTQPAFTLWESLTSILLDAGLSEEQAADGTDCLGRLLIGHALAEAGQPPGGDVGGGEEEHRQAQAALAAARYPALSRVQQANIVHDPRRIFELALDGLILALQAHHPHD